MPAGNSIKRYLPGAFILVVVLALFLAANPGIVFHILDPATAVQRQQERSLLLLGSAEAPLTAAEARDLLVRYQGGEQAAATALVLQDSKHGLPPEFIRELEGTLILAAGQLVAEQSTRQLSVPSQAAKQTAKQAAQQQFHHVAYLVNRLAPQRPFGAAVEAALAALVHPPGGGTNTLPITTLGHIGGHRPLADASLELLLDAALARSSAEQTALAAVAQTAQAFGLPEWALQRLEQIAAARPGQIRNAAIAVIAVAGAKQRALALVNTPSNTPVNPDTISKVLVEDSLPQLLHLLQDETQSMALRSGALSQIVKRRDQSELVGAALSYAFNSNEDPLRLEAIKSYSSWGRHHARFIEVDWPVWCARAFADDNAAIRHALGSTFQFIPFANLQARDQFLVQMLQGSESQQLSALRASGRMAQLAEPLQQAAIALRVSGNPDIASTADMLAERWRPKDRFEDLGGWLAASLLWVLLLAPAITAIGYETYFVARLLQSIGSGKRRLVTALVSLAWLGLSVALGLTLFMGLLGFGHGGHLTLTVYALLAVINLVFLGLGWLLSLALRQRQQTNLAQT